MSSATMMNQSRRQIQPPVVSSRRKEKDGVFDGAVNNNNKPSAVTTKSLAKPSIHRAPPPPPPVRSPQPVSNNQLLAGYLAHEFLTKGTLFGEPYSDPVRPEAGPSGEKRKGDLSEKQVEKKQRYMEVAHLLKGDGAHLSGIVNPVQLARFLQLR